LTRADLYGIFKKMTCFQTDALFKTAQGVVFLSCLKNSLHSAFKNEWWKQDASYKKRLFK